MYVCVCDNTLFKVILICFFFSLYVHQASELPREPLQSVSCRRRQSAALQKPLSQLLLALLRPGQPVHDGTAWNHTGPLCTLQTLPRQVCVCGVSCSLRSSPFPLLILIKHVRYYSRQLPVACTHSIRSCEKAENCGAFRSAVRRVQTHCVLEEGSVVWVALPHSVVDDNIAPNQIKIFYSTATRVSNKLSLLRSVKAQHFYLL